MATHEVIYIAANTEQAHLLRNALAELGIFAYVSNEALQMAAGDLPMGQPTAPRVIVDAGDAEEARRIAPDSTALGNRAVRNHRPRTWTHWKPRPTERPPPGPKCPKCERPRQTSCPVCETAGTKFPPAFMPADGRQEKPLLLCPTCDEVFAPEFLACCEWCGHRFRDGRELPPPPMTTPILSEMNARVWIVIAGLALLLAATFAMLVHIAPEP